MRMVMLLILALVLGAPIFAANAEEKHVVVKAHDSRMVRNAISQQFSQVLASPTIVDNLDYMEIRLVPNGFLTFVELLLEIRLVETLEGMRIETSVVKEEDGQRIPVYEEDTQKVLYLLIEGVQYELHQWIESQPPPKTSRGGFLLFDEEMKRLEKRLGGGPFEIMVAAYPKKGRLYKKTSAMAPELHLTLAENPARPGTVSSLEISFLRPRGAAETARAQKELTQWLKTAENLYLEKAKTDLSALFQTTAETKEELPPFKATYSAAEKKTGTLKSLLLQEIR